MSTTARCKYQTASGRWKCSYISAQTQRRNYTPPDRKYERRISELQQLVSQIGAVLFHAVKMQHFKAASFLLKKGAALDTQLTDGRTVMHCAAQNCVYGLKYHGVLRLLVRAGGNMLLPDSEGATPLDALGEAQQEGKKLYTHQLPGFKNYFQNRSLYLAGKLGKKIPLILLLM